jgi:hypothetical protein
LVRERDVHTIDGSMLPALEEDALAMALRPIAVHDPDDGRMLAGPNPLSAVSWCRARLDPKAEFVEGIRSRGLAALRGPFLGASLNDGQPVIDVRNARR